MLDYVRALPLSPKLILHYFGLFRSNTRQAMP